MKELRYKNFSLRIHKKNWQRHKPNVCQFELTFGCDFHCLYCYSDCYNNPSHIKNELSTNQIKKVLDKVYDAGCLWLCFTGGDPLKREDFLEIYAYAKEKGFIVTVFTNGYSLTREIADFFKDSPPFVVEITINATNKEVFEEITQVPDSYEKTFEGLNMLIERKMPLEIKTMVIKNNLKEIPKIEEFIRGLGLRFRPSVFIQPRLNKDVYPCSLRISPEELFYLDGNPDLHYQEKENRECFFEQEIDTENKKQNPLFHCVAGSSDGVYINPYAKMVFCPSLREFFIDLTKQDIQTEVFRQFLEIRTKTFSGNSLCRSCRIRNLCCSCPGYAYLEQGNMESPVEWYCRMAHLVAGKNKP